jgi:putative MATE family efflux protein
MVGMVARSALRYGASLAPHARAIRTAFAVGVPLLVRTLTLRVALLITTYVAATISTPAIAAHQVAFTVWSFLAFALDAIAIAGQALTGRLLGAGDAAGARSATRRMIWWGVVCGMAFGGLVIASRPLVVTLFTSDSTVQNHLWTVLLIVAVNQPIAGVVFVLDGVLIGAGDGRYLAISGVITLVVFAPLAWLVLWTGAGLAALWWAFSVFMLARMVTLVWRERSDRWLVLGAAARPT